MKEISAQEFVRRFKVAICEQNGRFTFFLGAGCSISSGIPGAGSLVKGWLLRLKQVKTGNTDGLDNWVKKIFPEYDPKNPATSYSNIIEELFYTSQERQREIETIVEGKDPGFGYAVLAFLITNDSFGQHCNSILTTNFDDMIADALYLYTNKKPLVIAHESLVGFAKIIDIRPTVFKIHGDARLAPMNTELETTQLAAAVKRSLTKMLSETGLIIIGYGGNDKTIAEIFGQLPRSALPWGVYWVGDHIPDTEIGTWLKGKNGIWVRHRDFDELMLLIRNEFGLKHPDEKRLNKIMTAYRDTFKNLMEKLEGKEDTADKKALEEAAEKAAGEFDNWFSCVLEADKYRSSNPKKAYQIFQRGFKKFENNPDFLSSYAGFLQDYTDEYDLAYEILEKSLEIDPTNMLSIINYAVFQLYVRKNLNASRELYEKALDIFPNNPLVLGRYAEFLRIAGEDFDVVKRYYEKAIQINPTDHYNLVNYAVFLQNYTKDYAEAELYFKKAIDLNPLDGDNLISYAGFLFTLRRPEEGHSFLEIGIKNTAFKPSIIEYWFYRYAHNQDGDLQKTALKKLKELIESSVRSRYCNLGDNVNRAILDGHPHPEFLKTLAKVISDEIGANKLDKFDIWRNISE